MATVSGMATSFDLPNYIGQLFQKSEKPNAILRLIGGLTGQLRTVHDTEFTLGVDYELPAASQPDVLEGADPSPSEQDTSQGSNVVQIFQESVKLSYTREARSGGIDGVAVIPGMDGHGELNNPGSWEWQIARKVEKVARDANYTFLRGAYQKPGDNTTARKTRGVRTAVTTNVFDNAGTGRDISKAIFENALRDMMANGSFNLGDTVFVVGDKAQIGALADLYKDAIETNVPESRTVAGLGLRQIVTTWATVNLVWEPDMDSGELFIFRPELCRVVALPIPEKGVLFVEPLAKTGSADERQLYGELGVDYRAEYFHGVIADLN